MFGSILDGLMVYKAEVQKFWEWYYGFKNNPDFHNGEPFAFMKSNAESGNPFIFMEPHEYVRYRYWCEKIQGIQMGLGLAEDEIKKIDQEIIAQLK